MRLGGHKFKVEGEFLHMENHDDRRSRSRSTAQILAVCTAVAACGAILFELVFWLVVPYAAADMIVNAVNAAEGGEAYTVVSNYLLRTQRLSSVTIIGLCAIALICGVAIVFVLGDNRMKPEKGSDDSPPTA